MSHLLKYKEWQTPYGWHVGDTTDLGNNSNAWWYPARMLNITPADYASLLINEFHVDSIHYFKDANLLTFYWKDYSACIKFVKFINAEAIKRKYII